VKERKKDYATWAYVKEGAQLTGKPALRLPTIGKEESAPYSPGDNSDSSSIYPGRYCLCGQEDLGFLVVCCSTQHNLCGDSRGVCCRRLGFASGATTTTAPWMVSHFSSEGVPSIDAKDSYAVWTTHVGYRDVPRNEEVRACKSTCKEQTHGANQAACKDLVFRCIY
jgi:hypothetical protein